MATKRERPKERPDGETLTLERAKTKKPRRYAVLMHNDDYTTQEFVVHVLMQFFRKDMEEATRLMLLVHQEGSARVGIYPKDVAETKVEMVMAYARTNGMPLMLSVTPD